MAKTNSAAVRGILPVARVLGLLLMLFSTTYLLPIACSLIFMDGEHWDFVIAMAINLVIGFALWFLTRRAKRDIMPREGFLLVSLSWVLMAVCATVPLMITIDGLSFTDAMFETISGLTTTGSTVLTGLDQLPPSTNLWRHELTWLGGMGIIVLAVAILPLLGVGGMQLYKAETPGPIKDDKLTPRITQTAKSLWSIYVALTALCAISYRTAGMSWLDAICHAFSTLSLGGFSTHDASFGYFNSPVIEAVSIVFMLLATLNFATHFLAWRNARLRYYWEDPEARAILPLFALSALGLSLFLWLHGQFESFWTCLRHVSFNMVSLATSSGFASLDYNLWPLFVPLSFLLLSCVGASSGSTGGGMKMIRALILFKQSGREMFSLMHPNAVVVLKVGGRVIPSKVVSAVFGYIHLYTISILVLTFTLLATGLDFLTAFSAVIASINNAGPGLNLVGPASNYGVLDDFQTWVCTFAMLLGRLEVFTLFVVLTPSFWRD
ncbi:MAG: potassium transporter TrkG [Stagnimonas sp.]|nr:potassium transporter TrkG [Stagnimonas sp.]